MRAMAVLGPVPAVLACSDTFKGHVAGLQHTRGYPVTVAQLESATATFQEEVEYFEGKRAVMPMSLRGGNGGYPGYGSGHGFMGPMRYGSYGGFGM